MKSLFVILIVILISSAIYPQGGTLNSDKLILLPVQDDPTVSIKIWFKVGAQNDPEGKEGLAYLTASMISDGATKKNSYEQILEKLYPLAAGYNANTSMEMTVYNGRVHKDNLNEYLSLYLDGVLTPAFNEVDFKRIKDEVLTYLSTTLKYSSDEELGKAVLYNNIFAGTPYDHLVEGTIAGIESITIDDVKKFYSTYYTRDNYVLALGGGYEKSLIERLNNDLQKLPSGNPAAVPKPKLSPLAGMEVVIVNKEAPATAISLGYPIDVVRGSKEWYALAIANSWLGEHRNSSSHLYQVIRESRGLNYGDYSYIEHFPNGGQRQMPPVNVARQQQIFEIWIRPVPNETKHFSLRAAVRELQKLVDKGMTEEDFELTKNFLSKYVLHYAPNTQTRLGYAVDDKFYGIEEGHLNKFRKMLNELTLEDVNSAIKKHLQYQNIKIAVVTNEAESFKKNLVSNAESPIEYSTPKSEEVYQEDKEIIKYHLPVTEDKVKILSVEDLF